MRLDAARTAFRHYRARHTEKKSQQLLTRLEYGREIYNTHCYFCHGYSGDAKTIASTYLDPAPLDFTSARAQQLSRNRMLKSVSEGRPETAMMSFAGQLHEDDIVAVVDFIRTAFMQDAEANTYYHIPENGWKDFQRYAAAFPFALGDIALDTPLDQLKPDQRHGRQLFMSGCITCHDRDESVDQGLIWEPRAVSYPRNGFVHGRQRGDPAVIDTMTAATPYARHDHALQTVGMTTLEQRGEALFQDNCAFCHAADGSGQNWIGSFLQPHPRNLTDSKAMTGMTDKRLRKVIENGLPGTTMSAWKSVLGSDDIAAIIAYISRVFYPIQKSEAGN